MNLAMPIIFLSVCLLVAGFSFPLILGMIERNDMFGFRIRRTMVNDKIWYKANKFAGWAMLLSAIVSTILLVIIIVITSNNKNFATETYSLCALLIPIGIAVVLSIIYAYKIPE